MSYIDPEKATRVRVFRVSEDEWNIDAIDDNKNYTEVCWDSYWEMVNGEKRWDTIESLWRAVQLVPAFIEQNVPHLAGTRPFVDWEDLMSRTIDQRELI